MIRYYQRSSNGYLCKKKITDRHIATSEIFVILVVIQKNTDDIVLHGPFHAMAGAASYKRRLETVYPEYTYEIQYLIPEKNLSKHIEIINKDAIIDSRKEQSN